MGGGLFGLFKMWRTFTTIGADIKGAFKGGEVQEYTEGKGWYEWPLTHLPIFMIITFVAMIVIWPCLALIPLHETASVRIPESAIQGDSGNGWKSAINTTVRKNKVLS